MFIAFVSFLALQLFLKQYIFVLVLYTLARRRKIAYGGICKLRSAKMQSWSDTKMKGVDILQTCRCVYNVD